MKFKILIFLWIILTPAFTYAQGCITIFSEQGVRFYLLLNGERQNPTPESNVRVDGLLNDNYDAKILFEDQTKGAISKTIMNTKNIAGESQERTYKIEHAKNGGYELVYIESVPVPDHFNKNIPGIFYTRYITPGAVENNQNAGGNGSGSITITPGMNLNVVTPEPNENGKVQISNSNSFSEPAPANTTPPAPSEKCAFPMDVNSFKTAKQTVAQASFEDTKLSVAQSFLVSNCMSTEQVIEICKLFGFEDSKLKFAKSAYPKTTDPENYSKVVNTFSFNVSKTELKNFISNGGR